MLTPKEVHTLAAAITEARMSRRIRLPITDEVDLDLDSAYAVQNAVTDIRLQRGERRLGWKLGYTSAAMRAQLGIAEPNFGPLTDAMILHDEKVPLTAMQPRVEPEVGLLLGSDLPSGADRQTVASCVAGAVACLEVVDSIFDQYRFRIEDNTADGSSAAWVVVGEALPLDALDTLPVRFERNGELVGTAVGADAGGHPFDATAWLATEVARHGQQLAAGHLIITGGLTAMVPLLVGDNVCATFGDVKVCVSR